MKEPLKSSNLSRWLGGWIPFWIYSALVIQSAILPPEHFLRLFTTRLNDKWVHGIEYFLLCLLAVNAFQKAKHRAFQNFSMRLSFAYCCAIGGLTELGQFFVPRRFPEWADFAVNAGGAGLGLLFCSFLIKIRNSKHEIRKFNR